MSNNTLTEGLMNEAALQGGILKERRIRVTALGVFRRGNEIFVELGYDSNKDQYFYRPLGGGIEFGERGEDTIAREMREETGLEITNVRYLGTCENIFTYMGEPGHEIVMLYEADFVDSSIYELQELDCREIDGAAFKSMWKPLDGFGKDGDGPLYPDGIVALLGKADVIGS